VGIAARSICIYHAPCGGGCGGCDWEVEALRAPRYDVEALGVSFADSPREADVLMVTGGVTKQSAPRLQELVIQTPRPKLCVVVGACGCSQGVFAGGYHMSGPAEPVIRAVDEKAKIIYVPGCPPRPETLIKALHGAGGLLDEPAARTREAGGV